MPNKTFTTEARLTPQGPVVANVQVGAADISHARDILADTIERLRGTTLPKTGKVYTTILTEVTDA